MNKIPPWSIILKQFYSVSLTNWQPLHSDNGNRIYRLDLADGQHWVLRIFAANDQSVASLAYILSFLERQSYLAEQIVHAVNNDVVVRYENMLLLMTHFVEGIPIDYSVPALYLLGKTLGKLHALSIENTPMLPKAEMLPAPELVYAWTELIKVADSVAKALHQQYDTLANAVSMLNRCENAPLVIIHNDCHPGNAICTSSKEVLLIDWHGAGLGPAVIDVGFLLASCEIPFQGIAPFEVNQERIPAIIDGYCQYHILTPTELDLLPDAIRFRALVYSAVSFANAISKHEAEPYDSQWWWQCYTRADEIAAMMEKGGSCSYSIVFTTSPFFYIVDASNTHSGSLMLSF